MKIDRAALKTAVEELLLEAEKMPITPALRSEILRTNVYPAKLARHVACGYDTLRVCLTRDVSEPGGYWLDVSCTFMSGAFVPDNVILELIPLAFGETVPTEATTRDPRIRRFEYWVPEEQALLS